MCQMNRSTAIIARLLVIVSLVTAMTVNVRPQELVDKLIATVSDGLSSELITLSDLRWQLALQPGVQLEPIRDEDLEKARDAIIDQRIFALEARRFPRPAPDDATVKAEIDRLASYFPSLAVFEERLRSVGFSSVKDDNFQKLIAQRVAIENYVEFRFRSFVVITPEEINRYYRDIYLPSFRRRQPGVLVPTVDSKRTEIRSILLEERVADRITDFLDDAKRRIVVDMVSEL